MGVPETLHRLQVHLRRNVSDGQVPATDKDNMFLSAENDHSRPDVLHARCHLTYELETIPDSAYRPWHATATTSLPGTANWNNTEKHPDSGDAQTRVHDVTTSEASVTLRYAPGESFVNSKQRRVPVSLDAPIFTLSHAMGFKGVLGGEYNFNRTEASIWKRFWLPLRGER